MISHRKLYIHGRSWYPAVLMAGLALFAINSAEAWWNSEWTLRKQIVIDTSAAGVPIAEAIGSPAVLVRLHDGNFNFGVVKPDGSDIRFVGEDDKTLLPYHLEKIDPILNEAFVWVKTSELKPSARNVIWLYYGNAGNKATKVEDAKATYDADTSLVYHFSERNQPAYDFTGNGDNAQNSGVASEGSMIGMGLRLDGRTGVTLPAAENLNWSERGSLTWMAWVKIAGNQPHAVLFQRRDGGRSFTIGFDSGIPFVEVVGPGGTSRTPTGAPVAPNSWSHLAVVVSGSTITLFINGEQFGSVNASLPALSSPATLGGENFSGEIDELQISRVARSTGFVKLTAFAQGGDRAAKLIAVGEDAQHKGLFSGLKTGYIGVIIGSLTVDGWVVIGILGVMSIVSWIVMVNKGRYLGRIAKGNTQFLKEWAQVASDLSVLDGEEDPRSMGGRINGAGHRVMRDSPLYRVYHIGVEEIRHRLAQDQSTGKVLSARSIQAIRASLDGGLVRESQRLNNQMVLLTIAISGGPFLGLLGTVVGVMITFAAVAMAGDVNVNAIAPGIAAALAATVAGLAVAIPALFGYNYLLTRIKTASNDLHIFIDEFVTKLAEFYSEPASVS